MLNLTLRPFATGSMICRSPQKQLVALPPPEAAAGVTLHPPEVGSWDPCSGTGDGSIAELGIELFPCLPRDQAAALWVGKLFHLLHSATLSHISMSAIHLFLYVDYLAHYSS